MNIEIMLSAGSISLDSIRHVLIPTYEVSKLGENEH